jgi:hypothetical protein
VAKLTFQLARYGCAPGVTSQTSFLIVRLDMVTLICGNQHELHLWIYYMN